MNKFTFVIFLCLGSQAFAGAYALECKDTKSSFTISKSSVRFSQADGSQLEGLYLSDSTSKLMPLPVQDFLKEADPKFFIDIPSYNPIKLISKKNFRDECGNKGQESVTKGQYRILDASGAEVKETTELKCTTTVISGHCA